MQHVTDVAALDDLLWLGDETWGERLARARVTSRVGLRGAAELVSEVWPTSFISVSRLEDLPKPPEDLKKRILATLVVLAYGYTPESFELSIDDVPRGIDLVQFIARARATQRRPPRSADPTSACLTEDDLARVA